MWTDSHNNPDIEYYLHIEPTTRCNAACPICARFILGSPVRHPHLKLEDLTVQNLDKWLGKEIISKVNDLRFCGDYGDPCSNPFLLDIIEYVATIRTDMRVSVNSNGGNRNPEFWKELASRLQLFRSHLVVFGIDGLESTNHLYRRNVRWSSLMDNVKAFIGNGGIAQWDFILFKHNEHQLEEARDFSKSLGFKSFAPKRSLGMEDYVKNERWNTSVYNKKGVKEYEIALPEAHTKQDMKLVQKGSDFIDIESWKSKPPVEYKPINIDYSKYSHLDETAVACQVGGNKNKGLYLTPNGTLLPCCHTGYALAEMAANSEVPNQLLQGVGGPDGVNLNKHRFSDIFKTFDSFFYDGWTKTIEKGKCIFCVETCGIAPKTERLYLEKNLSTSLT